MCFRVPHLYSKIPKNKHDVIQELELGRTQCKGRVAGSPWFTWCNPGGEITTRPVYTVCASAVISPLRQWLDSYAKTRFKMCHTFKHLLICNTFCCRLILLSLSLYIELALVCCTNPNNVNCFGTIFPNLNFVFASIWAASPVHIESDQYRSCSTVKQGPAVSATPSTPIGEQPKTALWLWVCEITCYLYTRWVHGRMKTKQRWFKVTRELSHEWFHHFRHHVHEAVFMTATGLENSPQSFGAYTVSQSRSVVTSAENPAPDNSPHSIGELRNGHVANLQELYYTRLVRKMAWYKILIHVLIV